MISRRTRQKETILNVLRGTNSHPTADWVYEQVRMEIPNISLGTVYRNLRLLTQEGKIMELGLPRSLSRFDANTKNHYHFRCDLCHQVSDLDEPVDIALDKGVTGRTGFKIRQHRLEFRGLCLECQRRATSS